MRSSLTVLVSFRTKPGRAADQVAAFEQLAPTVRGEAGCLSYDLLQVEDQHDAFVILERWASRDHLAVHERAPHMLASDVAVAAFRAGPADVVVLTEPAP